MTDFSSQTVDAQAIRERAALLRRIEAEARATAAHTGREAFHPKVLRALGRVPRHGFVAPALAAAAYLDTPLSIGYGQTISQPYIVALMTELAAVDQSATVLEIGTGSGYQAAVLAELAQAVYSIERIAVLAAEAEQRLRRLGYAHVQVRVGDGYGGWPEHAPYDAILVTAATPEPPAPLLEQLKPGGRLVVPLGPVHGYQELTLLTREDGDRYARQSVLPVRFVPFVHEPKP